MVVAVAVRCSQREGRLCVVAAGGGRAGKRNVADSRVGAQQWERNKTVKRNQGNVNQIKPPKRNKPMLTKG